MGLKLTDLFLKGEAIKATWSAKWQNHAKHEIRWIYQSLPIKDARIWECNMSYADASASQKTTIPCRLVRIFGKHGVNYTIETSLVNLV